MLGGAEVLVGSGRYVELPLALLARRPAAAGDEGLLRREAGVLTLAVPSEVHLENGSMDYNNIIILFIP